MSTICAISTAQGGAIGVVRVSGALAITIVNSIFNKDILESPARRAVYGSIMDGDKVIDDVIVTIFRAPHSYTGEDSVEISCHGSSYILQRIIELLIDNGCQMAQPGEYTKRAFMNGKMDLSQAEAVADLIASSTEASHRVAMSQMRGGISRQLAALREQLVEMTSLLELELDFSEEDVEFADREKLLNLAISINKEITRLSNSFSTGNALKNGIPVAIIGAPNVGKSTLLNNLLHDDRAIVSSIQGTTRDIIEDTFTIDGVLFRFIDTAGIRHTDDVVEQLGIERSIKAASRAQIIILMTEPGVDYPELNTRSDQTVIRVINKADQGDSTLLSSGAKMDETTLNTDNQNKLSQNAIQISALTGLGINTLHRQLLLSVPQINDNEVLITSLRHKQCLDQAHLSITSAITSLRAQLSGDLISEDLRQCLFHLAEILGEISNNEVLGAIFSRFCVGK